MISIVLTCYNHLPFLPIAVEGVRKQSYQDFEIIAIDDGSTDGTRDWLSSQPDIRCIFNETNLGTYATLNVGLNAAKGEFIAVLNDDDLWAPEKLAKQIELFEHHPEVGLVHTGGHFIDAEGKEVEGNPLGFAFPRFETGDILLGLVYENKIIASAALARRECFDQLGGFNKDFFGSGDWEMWFRIAEKWHVGFVDLPLTFYRVHAQSASRKLERIWKDDEKLREWMSHRLDLENRFPAQDIQKAKAFNYAALGTTKTLNGNPPGGRVAYKASLELDRTRWKTYARYLATFLPGKLFRKLL